MQPEVYIPPAETPIAAEPRRAGDLLPALFRRYVARMAAADAELRHNRESAGLGTSVNERTLPNSTIAGTTLLATPELSASSVATRF